MATEVLPDDRALRFARRERALAAMEEHDLDVLVLGRPANVRYVAGVPLLWNAGARPFGPGCVLLRSGEIYLLSTWDEGVPEEIPHDHLYGITWNPMNLVSVLQRISAEHQPRRVGTDALSPLFAKLLPTAFPGAEVVDGEPALRQARLVKTDEEVAAIRPPSPSPKPGSRPPSPRCGPARAGATSPALFMEAIASLGVTTPATQDVVRITTQPTRRRTATGSRRATSSRSTRASSRAATRARSAARGSPVTRTAAAARAEPLQAVGRAVAPAARRLPARRAGDAPARGLRSRGRGAAGRTRRTRVGARPGRAGGRPGSSGDGRGAAAGSRAPSSSSPARVADPDVGEVIAQRGGADHSRPGPRC